MIKTEKVSVHGGHSGQYCNHAHDTLEEVVEAYIQHGFSWVGITEHMPPSREKYLYPEENDAGLDCEKMALRFTEYISECRRLQRKYRREIVIFVGMEIECYSGYAANVEELLISHRPDYIVGSVHHVGDIPIDYSSDMYQRAVEKAGGEVELYCDYFDLQYEMLKIFKPAVVGHFDLIRIFDAEYKQRLLNPEILVRIERNLDFIKKHNLIIDYNLRSLLKGGDEPYVTESILNLAMLRGIAVVPGDDSHGVDSINVHFDRGIKKLREVGFSTEWQRPALYDFSNKDNSKDSP